MTFKKLVQLATEMNRYFTSGNEMPVEKAMVSADGWNDLYKEILSLDSQSTEQTNSFDTNVREFAEALDLLRERTLSVERGVAVKIPGIIIMEYRKLMRGEPSMIDQLMSGYNKLYERDNTSFTSSNTTALTSPRKAFLQQFHKLDNHKQVFFYEQDFYVLSNFSSFNLKWKNRTFPTSEHAYHWEKFSDSKAFSGCVIAGEILNAPSAHEAFKIAEREKAHRRDDWDDVKVSIMRDILREKANQHEYVRRKLLATGGRELIEDSWRDDYWGWGPNRDGKNMLGKLWTEIRSEFRSNGVGQE